MVSNESNQNFNWLQSYLFSVSDVSGSFTQGGYGSSFNSSAFKPAVSSSASSLGGYKQPSAVAGALSQPTGLGNYQSASSFQTQNASYSSGQSAQSSLYPNGNASASSFTGAQQSYQHPGNYQQQSNQGYQSAPGFHSNRDSNQSASSYQSSNASSYQNASNQQKASGSFQSQTRDSDSQSFANQSAFGASNANKLAEDMNKLGVSDSSGRSDHASVAAQYDANSIAASSSASSISGSTLTANNAQQLTSQAPSASGSATSGLGLTTQTSNLQPSKSMTASQPSGVTSKFTQQHRVTSRI